jgi:transcriptional regulator with PAS, ATPase and Fis domain
MTIIRKALALRITFVDEEEPVFDPALRKIVGECAHIRELRSRIAYCASFDGPVLLLGESGTGKDLVAGLIHAVSSRKDGMFLAKNCAAIPETIFEAEIFGCEKGAFTDAVSRAGSFEQASGGTLFLDEISEIPLLMQPKLLRILEENHVRRIGGSRSIPIDVRIITASNTDLREAVENKRFRKDLYYRICIFVISLPPLRERKEDIPLLAEHFIAASDRKQKKISSRALEKLQEYDWPGNVRELQNVMFRAVANSAEKKIEASHITFY